MGTNTDISAFLANGGTVTKCAPEASGKGDKSSEPFNGNRAGKRKRKASNRPASPHIDTSAPNWKRDALSLPAVQDSIKSGVYCALIGSGWGSDPETVSDMIQRMNVILLTYLDRWASYGGTKTKNTIEGYCRFVSYQKTVNYIKLSVHEYDGAVNTMKIDATDATEESAVPRVIADDTSALGFLRVEMRERLARASERLNHAERSHLFVLLNGGTSAQYAAQAGVSAVKASREKSALVEKLQALLAE